MSDFAALLQRVRVALSRTEDATPPTVPSVPVALRPAVAEDLVGTFIASARQAGAEVIETSDPEAVIAGLAPPSARVYREGQMWGCLPFEIDLAIVKATIAVAASGTVGLTHRDTEHLAAMAAPLLLVRVDPAHIVATIRDALARLKVAALPPTRVFMTGPSKTADIEGILITGVHGPGRVVIIVEAGPRLPAA